MKFIKYLRLVFPMTLGALAASCTDMNTSVVIKTHTNNDLDYLNFDQKIIEQVHSVNSSINTKADLVKLINNAQTINLRYSIDNSNKIQSDNKLHFKLMHSPVKDAVGTWIGFATKVKSAAINTLVTPQVIHVAVATATKVSNIDSEPTLDFAFSGIQPGDHYTFFFVEANGGHKIVFQPQHIQNNSDILTVTKVNPSNGKNQ